MRSVQTVENLPLTERGGADRSIDRPPFSFAGSGADSSARSIEVATDHPHPLASLRSACPLSYVVERGKRGTSAPSGGEVNQARQSNAPPWRILRAPRVLAA